ncbi:threonine--tRNA ligase [candidate division WOR-3 bacterium]|nr:threonine--tRNA ligase [candidate division WOR-3 bacterium]
MAKILLQGKEIVVKDGVSFDEVLKENLPSKFYKKVLVVKCNGELLDLSRKINNDCEVEPITFNEEEGKEVYRHSAAHIMAQAVCELYPGTKFAIGPAIENGFYYDFELKHRFTDDDLQKIEKKIKEIIAKDYKFERREVSREEALRIFKERDDKFKVEIIEELPEGSIITLYKQGEFEDLCRGPHIPSTGKMHEVKLLSVAGAYWRGDEKREQLQRIYGTAYWDKKELDAYLKLLEEAKKRDHRVLGKQLEIYSIFEEAGPGLIFWHPNGAIMRETIERFWKDEHLKRGYQLVMIPHIAKSDLWHTSGHYEFYRENMYVLNIDDYEYVLKPMNCPGHILIYKSKTRSYRDLPVKFAELGTVYRYERSGTLHGLLRVRGFTQDDGHVFCTPEQLPEEVVKVIEFAQFMMETFGYKKYDVELSVRDPKEKKKYAGTDEEWNMAESALENALKRKEIPYKRAEGEAVFYGPKIDIKLIDALGRRWQGPTIQFDFNLPKRFNVTYIGKDGKEHLVFMIHRALLGSIERFIGTLIEHYAGAFPVWIAPTQVSVLTITESADAYAKKVYEKLLGEGFRVEMDLRNEKINYKVREKEAMKVPYMVIVGDKEKENGKISVRGRGRKNIGTLSLDKFIEMVHNDVDLKR